MKAELSEARHALLQRYLRGQAAGVETKQIPKRNGSGPAPLSFSQQQIWLHAKTAGSVPIYNEPITIRRRGPLNFDALERAFTAIIRRHEAWRTTFEWEGDHGVQIIQPAPGRIEIPRVDLRAHSDPEHEAIRLATADALRPFDLARGPLYRPLLVSLGEDDHRLYLTLHHLIFDGVSLYRVFLRELLHFYEAFANNRPSELSDLPIQYPDYATWERATTKEIAPNDLAYWQSVLRDPPVLDLKTDRPRGAVPTHVGAAELIQIPAATTAALKALAQEQNATLFTVMVAAFVTLLHEFSGQEDIVLGGVSGGRRNPETANLLGCFLNTVPIRCTFSKESSFIDLLGQVRSATLGALSHDRVPLEWLAEKFTAQRDRSRAALVQALIVIEPPLDPLPAGWEFTHMDVDTGLAKLDLQLGLDDRPEGLSGRFIYNTALFDRATIHRMRARWLELLQSIATNPETSIARLTSGSVAPLPPPEWNGTRTDYPRDASIHELFQEQARHAPDATALVFGQTHLSYDQLNRRANRLAHRLIKLGLALDQPVGLYLERSVEMIVGLLAILKAGGAYVPLDPTYPAERLAFLIDDTQPKVVLTQRHLQHSLGKLANSLCLDAEEFSDEPETDPALKIPAENLAYILFTSGSTGAPKGVAIPHRAVVRLVKETNYADFSPNETFLQLAPLSFDASTFEIWGALLNGGRLVVMPPAPATLEGIGRAIREHGVTTLWLTSALFNAMVDERLSDLRSLRQLLAGGDVLSVSHVRKALAESKTTRLINGYGPTESTTFACCQTIAPNESLEPAIPIGRPIANTTAHILDSDLRPVAIGLTGELHLGGDGLARGYWRRDQLTAEKFIGEGNARLYKTGDLARWRDDGVIEFLGRADNQLKLRGFRIEPGEIEAALKREADVRDAAVILREDSPNEKRLVAYIVGQAEPTSLLNALSKSLPDYMLPSAIVVLPELPRTANGKLDRQALPAPQNSGSYAAPTTDLEEKVAGIWASILGRERVGVDDNFFELGGHSLLGLRLANRLSDSLGQRVQLTTIFEAPTVAAMARLLSNGTKRALPPIVAINRESRRARRD